MEKGAIDLIVTKDALEQLKQLKEDLKAAADAIVKVSKEAKGMKGSFKATGSKSDVATSVKNYSSSMKELNKNQVQWNMTQKKTTDALQKTQKQLKGMTGSMRKSSGAMGVMAVRVKSFFKTLVLFDLARKLVNGFFGAMKQGFEAVKSLDSIRLQFKFIVKDMQEVAQTQKFLLRSSEAYGAELITLSNRYVKFRAATKQSNISAKQSQEIFESVTKAAGVLGLKTHELQGIFLALEQMISKGKVTTEELRRQLGERLPGAMGIMADSLGVTIIQLDKMLKKGEVLSADALPKFAKQLQKAYGIESVKKVETLAAAQVRFQNSFTRLIRAIEDGNQPIKKTLTGLFDLGSSLLSAVSPAQKFSDAMVRERAEANALVNQIVLLNDKSERRKELLDKLMTNYPAFIKLIGDEEADNNDLVTALKLVNKQYIKRIALQKFAKASQEALGTAGKAQGKRAETELAAMEKLSGMAKAIWKDRLDLTGKSVDEQIEMIREGLKKSKIDRTREFEDLLIIERDFNRKRMRENEGFIDVERTGKELAKMEELVGDTAEALEEFFSEDDPLVIKMKINVADGDDDAIKKGILNYLDRVKKKYEDFSKSTEDVFVIKVLGDQIRVIEGFTQALTGNFDAVKTAQAGMAESVKATEAGMHPFYTTLVDLEKLMKDYNEAIADNKKKQDEWAEAMNVLGQSISALADIGDAIVEGRILNLEREMDAMNAKYDLQQELAENEITDEEAKEERMKQIAKQREIEEARIQKKIAKEKKKQFRINQIASLADIAINTAVWVTTAGKQAGIFGLTLAPLILALGGLQAAAVVAQPVPNFAEGHLAGTHSGFAVINDGGRPEVLERRDGSLELSNEKNKLVSMQRGDKVHKSLDSFVNQSSNLDVALANLLNVPQLNLRQKEINNDKFKEDLRKDVVNSLARLKITNNSTEVAQAVKDALEESDFKSRML